MASLAEANRDHVLGYGDDVYTGEAFSGLRSIFGEEAEIFLVTTGTGANALALKSLLDPFQGVLCPETAHLHVHECAAPEAWAGCKLLLCPSRQGKVDSDDLRERCVGKGDVHHVQPAAVSISQATECGTVYTPEELRKICEWAHGEGLLVHLDGARLCNAAVSLDTGLREISRDAGVDVLSLGFTKNGALCAEAVLFFDPRLAGKVPFLRKQGGQLLSKMRFFSVQFSALLKGNLWAELASHANAMARLLADGIGNLEGVKLLYPVETNGVFVEVASEVSERLSQRYPFVCLDETCTKCRWMASFDTTEQDVHRFIEALKEGLAFAQ